MYYLNKPNFFYRDNSLSTTIRTNPPTKNLRVIHKQSIINHHSIYTHGHAHASQVKQVKANANANAKAFSLTALGLSRPSTLTPSLRCAR